MPITFDKQKGQEYPGPVNFTYLFFNNDYFFQIEKKFLSPDSNYFDNSWRELNQLL